MTPRRRPTRQWAFLAAMLASALVHGVALAVLVAFSQTAATPLLPAPESPAAIEVSILADPRAGAPREAPDDAEHTTTEPPAQPAEAQAEQTTQPAEHPAEPSAELTDAPHPPEPFPPAAPPSPPAPPRIIAAPARLPNATPPRAPSPAPARPPAGATMDGRDTGTTDIILGANTAPPGVDPTALNTPPRYPPEAVRRGQQGIVQLRVLVATDGSAVTVEVAQSSGSALLDRAAREAVATWRFRPAQQTGITIPTLLPVSLSFSLIDAK